MPDTATLAAARPKCPVGPNRPGLLETDAPCLQPLRFDRGADIWVCPVHGGILTPQSLLARQGRP